jgi:hypothetical protein
MSILDDLEAPKRKDFRRVGKGTPFVLDPNGKRVRYRRDSTAGKILDDESNLEDWKRRTIVFGASQRPDLMAQVSTLDQEEDKKEIRDIVEECLVAGKGKQRATTGTAIHRMLDHVDNQDDWLPAPQFKDAVEAYMRVRDAYGLVPVDIEVQCINDVYRLAGTADRRYRTTRNLIAPDGQIIPIGSILLGDTKTGETLEYSAGSFVTQLAGYADSMRYDVDTDERIPFDPPTFKDWAIIVHVVADESRCDIYWVDLDAGRKGLALSNEVRQWREQTDLIVPARIPLHSVDHFNKAEMVSIVVDDDVMSELRYWLLMRIQRVKEAGDYATKALLRYWPKDVPGMKNYDGHTEEQLDAISEALWQVEKEYTLPFPGNDPRAPEVVNEVKDLQKHPRAEMIAELSHLLHLNSVGSNEVMEAVKRFAMFSQDEFSDKDVQEMLDGTLRAMGYDLGILDLSIVKAEHAVYIDSSAFALTTGTAMLLFDEHERPVVRDIAKG